MTLPVFVHGGVTSYCGDALALLSQMPSESVHCCVTSPPYFGLRDYGIDGQIGLEETPAEYVAKIVAIFNEVHRVLRADGTLWLNIGDSYANDGKWGGHSGGKHAKALHDSPIGRNKRYTGLKPKELIGIPWRVALALQADGWYLRSDCIWDKTSAMPESVKDRPSKSHEYIFLLSKSKKYFYDYEAVAEPVAFSSTVRLNQNLVGQRGSFKAHSRSRAMKAVRATRPQRLRAEQLAAEGGLTQSHIDAIRAVGVADAGKNLQLKLGSRANAAETERLFQEAKAVLGGYTREFLLGDTRNMRTVWSMATGRFKGAHFATFPLELPKRCILAGCPADGTVLDPFGGTGTTAKAARDLGRRAILLELNPIYIEFQKTRLNTEQYLMEVAA